MKLKHVRKLPGFRFCPDDKSEPELGAVVEVKSAPVALLLLNRGWGVEVKDEPEELVEEIE